MGISEDARAMKSYIEEHGWYQGALEDYDTPWGKNVCIVGSYKYAINEDWTLTFPESNLADSIRLYLGTDEIATWNDTPGRTKEEVLDMLENVAIKYQDDEMRVTGNDHG